jgi:hypothetical protein
MMMLMPDSQTRLLCRIRAKMVIAFIKRIHSVMTHPLYANNNNYFRALQHSAACHRNQATPPSFPRLRIVVRVPR